MDALFRKALTAAQSGVIKADFHMHTRFCDGADTPEEMVLSALEKGLAAVGLSGHSYTFFDESYCMSEAGVEAYCAEVALLKEKYKDQIEVFCGVEQDFYSASRTDRFDYVIGSVHYLHVGGCYVPVDETPELLRAACETHFDGDVYALCECYFDTVARVAEKTACDVIGHFDLITKFNEPSARGKAADEKLFDEAHPRYVAAWQKAADRLLEARVPFEINFGAITRGWRSAPYPSAAIQAYLRDRGAIFVRSSDSHQKETIGLFNPAI